MESGLLKESEIALERCSVRHRPLGPETLWPRFAENWRYLHYRSVSIRRKGGGAYASGMLEVGRPLVTPIQVFPGTY
jgi:hypothetical protein